MMKMKSALLLLALIVSNNLLANVFLSEVEKEELNQKFSKASQKAIDAFSGADIVGNGGGALEQSALYIYSSLDRYISQCLNKTECVQGEERRIVLRKIRDVILLNRDEKNRLVFLSGENFEKYMQDNLDPEVRVAKTGFSDEFPIFINLEEVRTYSKDAVYASMVALLVHEIGHQVGVASHSFLDDLALSVRSIMEFNTKELSYEVLNSEFKFTLFSSNSSYDFAQYVLEFDGVSFEVPSISSKFKCRNGDKLIGANLENPYWEKGKTIDNRFILAVNGWGNFYCERKNKTIYFEQVNVRLTWKFSVEMLPGDKFSFLLDETNFSLN